MSFIERLRSACCCCCTSKPQDGKRTPLNSLRSRTYTNGSFLEGLGQKVDANGRTTSAALSCLKANSLDLFGWQESDPGNLQLLGTFKASLMPFQQIETIFRAQNEDNPRVPDGHITFKAPTESKLDAEYCFFNSSQKGVNTSFKGKLASTQIYHNTTTRTYNVALSNLEDTDRSSTRSSDSLPQFKTFYLVPTLKAKTKEF